MMERHSAHGRHVSTTHGRRLMGQPLCSRSRSEEEAGFLMVRAGMPGVMSSGSVDVVRVVQLILTSVALTCCSTRAGISGKDVSRPAEMSVERTPADAGAKDMPHDRGVLDKSTPDANLDLIGPAVDQGTKIDIDLDVLEAFYCSNGYLERVCWFKSGAQCCLPYGAMWCPKGANTCSHYDCPPDAAVPKPCPTGMFCLSPYGCSCAPATGGECPCAGSCVSQCSSMLPGC